MQCRVSYYEFTKKITTFKQPKWPQLIVDGYTGEDVVGKFSLGSQTNLRRTYEANKTVRQIGGGVRIFSYDEGIYIQNYSENNVFLLCPFHNDSNNLHNKNVIRLAPTEVLKLFDYEQFKLIATRAKETSYEAVYNLIDFCTTYVSFVKGFGENYSRQYINQCPCWIEFTLEEPLDMLDEILQQLGSSSNRCTSTT